MSIQFSAADRIKLELTGADIAGFLSLLSRINIPVHDVVWKDTLSVSATLSSRYKKIVLNRAEKSGVSVKIVKEQGTTPLLIELLKRPVLISGIIITLLLAVFLPTRILQIEVEGNRTIPDNYIIEAAELCGVGFGAKRSTVRSEIVKNKLLEMLPQLQWAGVNTYGCKAVISVTEKSIAQKESDNFLVSSMIACNDGIIASITATKGNMLCSVGQAVKKGQVLISGYLDCGNIIQATRAEGEIFAHTKRTLTAISPLDFTSKDENSADIKKYSIIFGKNRINLSKDSGISTTGCDKMYTEYPLVLPGGFTLPVALAVEHWKGYNDSKNSLSATATFQDLSILAEEYLSQLMISGKVVSKAEDVQYTNNAVNLKGVYNCLEMIGITRAEEIIDGKDH